MPEWMLDCLVLKYLFLAILHVLIRYIKGIVNKMYSEFHKQHDNNRERDFWIASFTKVKRESLIPFSDRGKEWLITSLF